ncbi:pimeloyl-ACP methyl ester carboxylesterase [Paraburkholderia sp. WC7.3g]
MKMEEIFRCTNNSVADLTALLKNQIEKIISPTDTGGTSTFVPLPTEGIKLLNFVYREPTLENVKRMMNVFVYDPSALTDDLLQQRVNNLQANKHHVENWVASMAANPRQFTDYQLRLSEIKAPTLIVWGREDRFLPFDIGLRLLSGLQEGSPARSVGSITGRRRSGTVEVAHGDAFRAAVGVCCHPP